MTPESPPPLPQTVPVWAVLASAAIGALATLFGNVIYWYLKRESRTDSQRRITHEKQLEMVLEIDKDIQSLLRLNYLLAGARGIEKGVEEAIEVTRKEKGLKPEDLDRSKVIDLKEQHSKAEWGRPKDMETRIETEAFTALVKLRRAGLLLPEKPMGHAANLQRCIKQVIESIGDQEAEREAFGDLWKARAEFILSCRKELLVEELTTETKDLVRDTKGSVLNWPEIPKPYIEFGMREDE